MKKLLQVTPSLRRPLLSAGLTAFALAAAMPAWQNVHAQSPAHAPMSVQAAVHRHVEGLALAHRGDQKGAFIAFLEAAENGYPPAQRRLGEIYDSGNSAVERDYSESIRWYEKAREGGEQIPPPKSPMPAVFKAP
jgi:TPR repeat protein